MILIDSEINDEQVGENQLMYEIAYERQVLGKNLGEDCKSITSNFCCALKMKEGQKLVEELNQMLPKKEAWPDRQDTKETLLLKSEKWLWYDEEWMIFRNGTNQPEPNNGSANNRQQAYRR